MQLHFQTYGSGHPLVILHGLLGSLENWHSVSLRLAEHYQVFALDQRNHGRSPHHEEMTYTLMAQDVSEFIRSQNLSRAHVLGHSMGGKTAMQFALWHPEQLDKLVVVDMAPRAYAPQHNRIFEGLLSLRPEAFQTRAEMEAALEPWVPEKPVRQFLLKNLTRDETGQFRWKIGLRQIESNYLALGDPVRSEHPCACPALFLRGEKSGYLTEADLPPILTLFPNASLRTIPRASHLVHVDNLAGFLSEVVTFLGV